MKTPPLETVELRFIGPAARRREAVQALKTMGFVDVSDAVLWRQCFPDLTAKDIPGHCLRGARAKEGMTQRDLAQHTGIPQRHISELENGKRPIGKDMAKKLGEALNLGYQVFQKSPMTPHRLTPNRLAHYLGNRAPGVLTAQGNLDILKIPSISLFCSIKSPGDLSLKTYDLACTWRAARHTVIGGSHSPMEKECLRLLLRGTQPVIICPAHTLPNHPGRRKGTATEVTADPALSMPIAHSLSPIA